MLWGILPIEFGGIRSNVRWRHSAGERRQLSATTWPHFNIKGLFLDFPHDVQSRLSVLLNLSKDT